MFAGHARPCRSRRRGSLSGAWIRRPTARTIFLETPFRLLSDQVAYLKLSSVRSTQRVGIVPDVEVRPTIDGIRLGRDEVLEEALRQILGRQTPADQIEKMARPGL